MYNRRNFRRRRPNNSSRLQHPQFDYSKFINKVEKLETAPVHEIKNQFADFALDRSIIQGLKLRGYITPTPIQDQAIPLILEGKDVIGLANTGSGKTGAFLLPLLHFGVQAKKEAKPFQALILAPTRELALQIEVELFKLESKSMGIFSVCCTGGSDIRQQMRRLRKPNQFIIGTPGRVIDLTNRGLINLPDFTHVVLDEVDHMLDMGFVDDMVDILSEIPASRQSLFFSATINKAAEKIMNDNMKDPVKVSVVVGNTAANINQDIIKLEQGQQKITVLSSMLNNPEFNKVLVFSETKMGADIIQRDLGRQGVQVESIHGDKSQGERQNALRRFKRGDTRVLVATDVAARGLDISNVSHVINYEIPKNYDQYVHRIGRTGRAGKAGQAYTFVD